jgi:hypothetical protein
MTFMHGDNWPCDETCDHPTRSPDSPDPRGNAAIEAIERIQRAIHMKDREASDGTLVTAAVIVQEAREAIRDFHNAPPRSPDSVRTPNLDALGLTRHYNPATGQLWHHDDCPDEDHRYDLHAVLAALHPASPPQPDIITDEQAEAWLQANDLTAVTHQHPAGDCDECAAASPPQEGTCCSYEKPHTDGQFRLGMHWNQEDING